MKTRGKKGKKASGAEARDRSGQATTRSTAGPGFAFEDQVAAWLLLKMLTGETIPGMDGCLGLRLQSQTSALEWLNKGSSLRLTFDYFLTQFISPSKCNITFNILIKNYFKFKFLVFFLFRLK